MEVFNIFDTVTTQLMVAIFGYAILTYWIMGVVYMFFRGDFKKNK